MHYAETDKEARNREGIARRLRLYDAQARETTPTMVKFDHDTHVLRVANDSFGDITVIVRDRATGKTLHRVRFTKKPHRAKLGVVYSFRKATSLWSLYVEPELLPALEAAAAAHDQAQAARGH